MRNGSVKVVRHVVTQGHRKVGQERSIAISFYEVNEAPNVDIGAVVAKCIVTHPAIPVDHRLVIPRSLVPTKDIAVLKAKTMGMVGDISQQSQLPFAKYSGRVTCFGKDSRKSGLLGTFWKSPPGSAAVSVGILAGH